MDIYDYLKMDHKKVAKLFKLYETATTEKNKLEIFSMIKTELLVHADSEAATFYKALEENKCEEVLHGEKEHQEIKHKLDAISKLNSANKKMDDSVMALKKLVEHHVSDEEGKIFRAAKKVLSDDQAWVIKEKMHDLKCKMLLSTKMEEELMIEDGA